MSWRRETLVEYLNVVAGGAAIGVIASCWSYIKGFAWKLTSLLIQRVEIQDNDLSSHLISYLVANYRRSSVYDRRYHAAREHIRSKDRTGDVPYEAFGDSMVVFWHGWVPFVMYTNKSKDRDGDAVVNLVFAYLRGTLDIDALAFAACQQRNQQTWDVENQESRLRRRFFIRHVPDGDKSNKEVFGRPGGYIPWYQEPRYRVVGYSADDLGPGHEQQKSQLESLVFPTHITRLISEIRLWRASRDWYHKRNIPWKRGWLLHGKPGVGKTALARAFAEDLDLPIYVFNLAALGNFGLIKAWREMQASTPCIALLEDFDNVFHGRKNVTSRGLDFSFLDMPRRERKRSSSDERGDRQQSGESDGPTSTDNTKDDDASDYRGGGLLTFDCLLNCLDGIEKNDGVFTIITTNDLTKIDSAIGVTVQRGGSDAPDMISTRPGRVDKVIELTYLDTEGKRQMASRILAEYPDELEQMNAHILKHPEWQETPAQFQERCAQVALRRYWEDKEAEKRAAEQPAEIRMVVTGERGHRIRVMR